MRGGEEERKGRKGEGRGTRKMKKSGSGTAVEGI